MRTLLLAATALMVPAAVFAAPAPAPQAPGLSATGDASATISTSTGSSTARKRADRDAAVIDVIDYGAVPDGTYFYDQFSMTAGSATLTATKYYFPASTVGKTVVVPGAGASGVGLVATITAASGTTATLSTAASTTVTSSSSSLMLISIGTDNTAAINNAIAAARKRQATTGQAAWSTARLVFSPGSQAGEYLVGGSLNFTSLTAPGFSIEAAGTTIHSVAAGQVAVDMVGSNTMDIDRLRVIGDTYASPKIGIQIGRIGTTATNSSGTELFNRLYVDGSFTFAGVLNEQSETTTFVSPLITNKAPNAFAGVFDGSNHFCMSSAFVASFPQGCGTGSTAKNGGEGSQAFGENVVLSGEFRTTAAGSVPFWFAGSSRLRLMNNYMANEDPSGSSHIVEMIAYEASGAPIQQPFLDVHSEDMATTILQFTGPAGATNVTVNGLYYRDNGAWTSGTVFSIDPASSITSVTLPNANIDLNAVTGSSATLFDTPADYTLSGNVYLPSSLSMGAAAFSGNLCQGTVCNVLGAIPQSVITTGLANQGITTANYVKSVAVTQNSSGFYISNTTAPYQIPLVFSAPASGGTTATGLLTVFGTYGGTLANAGTAGTDTYADNGVYAIKDANGNTLPFTIQVRATNGAITSVVGFTVTNPLSGYSSPGFNLVNNQIPQGPFKIVKPDGSGTATINQISFPVMGATVTNGGTLYATAPTVTASSAVSAYLAGSNPYSYAASMSSILTLGAQSTSGQATFGGPENHGGTEGHTGAETHSGAETHTGIASFSQMLQVTATDAITPATITAPASGSAPSGATQLAARISRVTTCSSTQPLQLPSGPAAGLGNEITLVNDSGAACPVYPPSGGQINGAGANVADSVAAAARVTFRSESASSWYQ